MVIGTPYAIVIVPRLEVPEIWVNVMSPVRSVCPVLVTVVTGMLPTENVACAKAAAVRPRNITAATRIVLNFID